MNVRVYVSEYVCVLYVYMIVYVQVKVYVQVELRINMCHMLLPYVYIRIVYSNLFEMPPKDNTCTQ